MYDQMSTGSFLECEIWYRTSKSFSRTSLSLIKLGLQFSALSSKLGPFQTLNMLADLHCCIPFVGPAIETLYQAMRQFTLSRSQGQSL
jgi:hypothetical protein